MKTLSNKRPFFLLFFVLVLWGAFLISGCNNSDESEQSKQSEPTDSASLYVHDFQPKAPVKNNGYFDYRADKNGELASFNDAQYGIECHLFRNGWDGIGTMSCVNSPDLTTIDNTKFVKFPISLHKGDIFIERLLVRKDFEICYLAHSYNWQQMSCVIRN